ncbi:MAG: helix-turn-helix domain-containing protein [Saprospiraceae bacterium]
MIINQFNLTEGISIFNESNLVADFHAHPSLEIILAQQGTFTLSTKNKILKNIKFGIVKANIHHALHAENCECDIIMMEMEFLNVEKLLVSLGQKNNNNSEIFSIDKSFKKIISNDSFKEFYHQKNQSKLDDRIINCINFIKKNLKEKELSLLYLAKEINLSPSRLSHLFKEQIGVSVQNYIIWTRMKIAVNYMINNRMHLTDAALHAGFYDTAHFSRHFKKMFGVKPSLVYNNSIIVQDF